MGVDQQRGNTKFNPETGLYERVEGGLRGGQEVEQERNREGEQESNREGEQDPSRGKTKWGEEQEKNGEKLEENERRGNGKGGKEKERGAGGGGEHQLWAGCLFDAHCHLNLVLR